MKRSLQRVQTILHYNYFIDQYLLPQEYLPDPLKPEVIYTAQPSLVKMYYIGRFCLIKYLYVLMENTMAQLVD